MSFLIVNSVLQELGLIQYVKTFQENDIDDSVLQMLSTCTDLSSPESQIFSTVVPSRGHQIKIIHAIRLLKPVPKGGDHPSDESETRVTPILDQESDELVGAVGYTSPSGEPGECCSKNAYEFCGICKEMLNMGAHGNGIKLKICYHSYCRNCLGMHIRKRSDYQLKCPEFHSSLPNQPPCSGYLILAEITEVLSNKDFQDYCKRAGHADSALEFYATSKGKPKATIETNGLGTRVQAKQVNVTEARIAHNGLQQSGYRSNDTNQSISDDSLPNDSALQEDERLDIKLSSKDENCNFCKLNLKPFDGIVLQTCYHVYCRDCLLSKIQHSNGLQVRCAVENETMCAGFLLDREIKSLTTATMYSDYVKKSYQVALRGIPVLECSNEKCSALFELDIENPRKSFLCPICQSLNCIKCKALHEDLTCEQYTKVLSDAKNAGIELNSEMFKEMMDIEKKDGFDYLTSTMIKLMSSDPSKQNRSQISYADTMQMMELMNVIPTSKQFECSICANEEVLNGVILKECLHMFCRECIENVVRHSDDPEIHCPTCQAIISSREIREIVSPELFEAFLNRSVVLAEKIIPNTFHCMTKDCPGWCVIEGAAVFFPCPVCERGNCIQCKDFHENLTCKEFQDKIADDQNRIVQRENELLSEREVESMVANRTYNRCPRCKYICQKISGCNSVTCGACKVPFTWQGA